MTRLERVAAILAEPITDPRELAASFCGLDDEQQAQFFIECAAIMATWRGGLFEGRMAGEYQMGLVGKHLRTCTCSNDDARELVRALAEGLAAE